MIHTWRGQNNAGVPNNMIYYGTLFIPSWCAWMIPGLPDWRDKEGTQQWQ